MSGDNAIDVKLGAGGGAGGGAGVAGLLVLLHDATINAHSNARHRYPTLAFISDMSLDYPSGAFSRRMIACSRPRPV